MNLKSGLQILNLGLSIFNKAQMMQHRQIRMANDLAKQRIGRRTPSKKHTDSGITEAEIIESTSNQY